MPQSLAPYQMPEIKQDGVFVSVHLNSNRPVQIVTFLQALENTAHFPERVEVIINIDKGDEAMLKVLREQQQALRVHVRWIETDIIKSFADTWKPYNLILPMTDPNAYFVILLSDEMLFEDKDWDLTIAQYVGYYPDHIFRLRASVYRWRNYTDYWECGFAPDSVCFYTRPWLMIQGDWNPCNGPDSFQQCVSYYLSTSDPFSQTQYHRDVVLPFLRFSGEGVSIGMDHEAQRRRMAISTRMWFILVSHRYQQDAKRRAMLLKANILAHKEGALAGIEDNNSQRMLIMHTKQEQHRLHYGLSYLRITLRNLMRLPLYQYYGGGGRKVLREHPKLGIYFVCDAYMPWLRKYVQKKHNMTLAYYRWRNTKMSRVGRYLQRYPGVLSYLRQVRANMREKGKLRGLFSAPGLAFRAFSASGREA